MPFENFRRFRLTPAFKVKLTMDYTSSKNMTLHQFNGDGIKKMGRKKMA